VSWWVAGALTGVCLVLRALTSTLGRRLAAARGRAETLETRLASVAGVRESKGLPDSPGSPPDPAASRADGPGDDDDHPVDVGSNGSDVLAGFAAAARAAAMTDPMTGLFNEEFFLVTLESRISSARRHLRPVAVALLEVAEGVRAGDPTPVSPAVVADGLRLTLREADTACRLPDGRFALVLEDTPENGAVWTVERVRRTLASDNPGQTMWAGVACYPAHAFDAEEVLDRAVLALEAAKEWRQDRIEVATVSDD
jgi:diguanylate cyclase (GGDEF)-like protein